MQEITLPTSSSALTALNATPSNWTSGKNIAWSKAGADVTWAGKKGNVAAGQLLIGQLGSETATVTPASYDLGAQELTLVDIDGKTAPVTVTATAAEGDYVTDRAASPSGKWNLAIAMTDEVTADNIATAFTKKVNGVDKNVKYALAVNGTVMTGYEYVIDTQTVNESKTNTAYNKANIGLASANVALGTSTLSLNAATAAQAYDSYLTFEGASKTLAEAKGITVDGMNITVPATAAATPGLSVTVNILDITGKIAKKDVVLTIAGASVSETETVAPVSIKISTVNSFSVDLGTIFTNLDANIAQNADATKTTVTTADGNFFALTSATSIGDGLYKVAENTAIAFKKADGGAATIAARNAIKAVITLNYTGSKYTTAAKDLANIYGTFNLTLTLKDAQGNELKKVIVPVTVSKPEFDDYYTANQYAGWNEGILSSVIDNSGNSPAFTMPTNLYTINKKADGTGMTDAQPGYTYTYKKAAVDNSEVKEAASITFTDVVKDGFLKTTDYKVKANKEVVTVNALTGASNAAADNTISVSKEFTMKLAPAFNKAKLVYYTNGVAGTVAAVNADGIIAALTEDKTANKPKNGLALQYGDEEIAVSTTAIPASASASNKLGGYQVSTADATSGATIKVGFAKSAESAGGSVTLEAGDTGVKITGLNAGQGGELVVTFTDYAGIKTQATIEYKK